MERIVRRTRVRSDLGEREVEVLFDTGAESSFIRRDIAVGIGSLVPVDEPVEMITADGRSGGFTTEAMMLKLDIEGHPVLIMAFVTKKLAYEFVLGCIDMERYDIRPIPKNGQVIIPPPRTRTHLI